MGGQAGRVGLVTTVREPTEKVVRFVNYHLNVGVDHVHVFLDDPADPFAAVPRDPRVAVTRCDGAHWERARRELEHGVLQGLRHCRGGRYLETLRQLRDRELGVTARQYLNASLALAEARSTGLDWLFHVDGDELIHAPAGLKSELAGVPASVECVVFSTLEAVPEGDVRSDGFSEVTLFRSLSRFTLPSSPRVNRLVSRAWEACHATLGRLAGCGRAFFQGGYFRGHAYGKIALRTASPAAGFMLHNAVSPRPLRVCRARGGRILHYDCVTFEDWAEKWKRRYVGTVARPHRRRRDRMEQGDRFIRYHAEGNEPGMRALYTRLYFIPPREQRRLCRLGLLRRVHLPPELFRPSS
jgi:hypothetical protein